MAADLQQAARDPDSPVEFLTEMIRHIYSERPLGVCVAMAVFPVLVQSPAQTLTLTSEHELTEALELLRLGLRALGVASVTSELLSINAVQDNVIVATMSNERFQADGSSLGAHRSTYVTGWTDEGWRIRSLVVGDERKDSQIRKNIEAMFRREFIGTDLRNSDESPPSHADLQG